MQRYNIVATGVVEGVDSHKYYGVVVTKDRTSVAEIKIVWDKGHK